MRPAFDSRSLHFLFGVFLPTFLVLLCLTCEQSSTFIPFSPHRRAKNLEFWSANAIADSLSFHIIQHLASHCRTLVDIMAKDESKKEKKSKRKSEGGDTTMGDVSVMSVDSPAPSEKKSKKEKKSKSADEGADDDGGEGDVPVDAISPIAQPLAQRKLSKKVFKTIKKASKSRGHVKRGVKEVVKGLRKGDKGCVAHAFDAF